MAFERPAIITQRMLELRFGAKTVRDLLDHDRDGAADPERVEEVLNEATDVVIGILSVGFTFDQIVNLAERDYALKGYCCDVAIGVAAKHRPGLLGEDGKTPFEAIGDRAEAKLKEIANGTRRLSAEAVEGRNLKIGTSVNRGVPPYNPIFQGTANNKTGPGGF